MSKSSRDPVESLRQKLSKDVLRSAVDQLLGTTARKRGPSQADLEMKVVEIVYLYNCTAEDPTLYSQVRDELQEIEKAAEKLIKRIERSDPLTMSRFRATHLRNWFLQGKDTADLLDDRMLADGRETKLVTLLRDITHVAKQARAPDVWHVESGKKAEYSGPEHAKRGLVGDCILLFKTYRSGGPKATEGSDFFVFLSFVWELATGKSEVSLRKMALPLLKLDREADGDTANLEKSRSDVIKSLQQERRATPPAKSIYPKSPSR